MNYGFTFDTDGNKTGVLTTLRYSAYDTWCKSPSSYRDKYYEGETFVTPETVFGHEMHKIMEKPHLREIHPILKDVPCYAKCERDITLTLSGVKIGGRIDSMDLKKGSIIDYKFGHRNKEGKVPWDSVKVARHRQLVFYSILVKEKDGVVDPWTRLVWIETAFETSKHEFEGHILEGQTKKLQLTGNFEVFKRQIFKWERDKMKADIIRVAKEINEDFMNKAASELGKLSHKKSPRTKEQMSAMGKKGMASRWKDKNKLSTGEVAK